jgi:hypothetical protein
MIRLGKQFPMKKDARGEQELDRCFFLKYLTLVWKKKEIVSKGHPHPRGGGGVDSTCCKLQREKERRCLGYQISVGVT